MSTHRACWTSPSTPVCDVEALLSYTPFCLACDISCFYELLRFSLLASSKQRGMSSPLLLPFFRHRFFFFFDLFCSQGRSWKTNKKKIQESWQKKTRPFRTSWYLSGRLLTVVDFYWTRSFEKKTSEKSRCPQDPDIKNVHYFFKRVTFQNLFQAEASCSFQRDDEYLPHCINSSNSQLADVSYFLFHKAFRGLQSWFFIRNRDLF